MISGNPDERMAFVLTTEAHLEGIRQGRAEIRGIGSDTDVLGNRLGVLSAKSQAAFDAMDAGAKKAVLSMAGLKEADLKATVGVEEHGRAAGKDAAAVTAQTTAIEKSTVALMQQRRAAEAAAQALIPRSPAAYAGAANALANAPMLGPRLPPGGLVAENARIAASFDPISNKARTAANAMSTLSFAAAGLTSGGAGTVMAMGALTSSLAHLSSSARIAASASGIGAIVVVAATLIPLLMRMGRETELVAGGFRKAFGGGDDASAGIFLQLARARRQVAEQSYADSQKLTMGTDLVAMVKERAARKTARDEAVADEQAAINAVFAAGKAARDRAREEAKQEREDQKRDRASANDLYFAISNERVLAEMRGPNRQEAAEIEQIEIDRVNRELEINKLRISEAERADLIEKAREASEARVTAIQDQYADERLRKADEDARKHESIEKRRAAKRLSIARENVHAIVMAEGSILQTLKRLALEPVINELEGIAAREAVKSLASFASMDLRGGALHAAAAIAATAAAREVAGWAGGGSKGGGGASASGGGGGSGSFEPRQSTAGQGSAVINLYSMNPFGPELIQQVKFELGRADILKRPGIQIAPTSGLKVA